MALGVWNDCYSFETINAKGEGNISELYQDRYQSDEYDLVLILCDTDKKPHKSYKKIQTKINEIHGANQACDLVIIYMNFFKVHFNTIELL